MWIHKDFRKSVGLEKMRRDDHAKNVSFMMDSGEKWRLAPFYDLTYNLALGTHAMSLNGTTMPEQNDFAEVFGVYGCRYARD